MYICNVYIIYKYSEIKIYKYSEIKTYKYAEINHTMGKIY